jgi:hypothetical protein
VNAPMRKDVPDLPLEDETGDIGFERPMLKESVRDLVYKLMSDIEALSDGNPYWSSVYFTPQGSRHTVYVNGEIKGEGAEIGLIKCRDFSGGAQMEAFRESAAGTLACIAHDRPASRNRLIWRRLPEASRVLRDDGLYIKIYTRLGWDKSEGE